MGQKFSDNSKHLYLYTTKNQQGIYPIWISKSNTVCENLKKEGLPVAHAYSLRGIWLQIRAGIVFYTHSVQWDFIPQIIGLHTKRVQLWHGIPLKKIGFDDDFISNRRIKSIIKSCIFPFLNDINDLVIACSDYDRNIYSSAFNVRPNNVVITGYPRNDELICQKAEEKTEKIKIAYLPTFRGEIGSDFKIFSEYKFDIEKWAEFLKKINAELIIKLHPVQKIDLNLRQEFSSFKEFRIMNELDDINTILKECDVFIIDYSSIYFDLLLMKKPFIMAPLDLNEYLKKERALYINYKDISPEPLCLNWAEVQIQLEQIINRKITLNSRYSYLLNKFHKNTDNQSSARVFDLVYDKFVRN